MGDHQTPDVPLPRGSLELISSRFEYHTDGNGLHVVHEGVEYVLVAEEGEEPRLVRNDAKVVPCDRCDGVGRHLHEDGISRVKCEDCGGTGEVVDGDE